MNITQSTTGPARILSEAGFTQTRRTHDATTGAIVVSWQRRRTYVRLDIVVGSPHFAATFTTPGGHTEVVTDLDRLIGRVAA